MDVLKVGERIGNSKASLAKGKDVPMEEQMGSRLRSRSRSPINDRN